jgi:hypothetical protein
MYGELERSRDKVVVACWKVPSRNLPEMTDEDTVNLS